MCAVLKALGYMYIDVVCSSCTLRRKMKRIRQLLGKSAVVKALDQGGHGTGKTGNLAVNFSRQGKHMEFSKFIFYTGKIVPTQGKF